jgi:hypothetical protein
MGVMEAVASHLAANTHGTIGTDLWMGEMPDSPDVSRCVYESPGQQPIETFGASPWATDRPRIRVVVRGARDDYPGARDEAAAIRVLLASITEQTIAGVKINRLQAMGYIEPLGKDSEDRPLFAVDFQAWTE